MAANNTQKPNLPSLKDEDNRGPTPPLFPSPRLVALVSLGGRVTDSNGLGPRKAQVTQITKREREKKAPFPPQPFHQLHKQQNHRLSGWGWSICYCQCIALVVVKWVVSALLGGGGGGLRLLAIAFTMLMLRFSSANLTLDWRAGLDAYSTGACGSVAYTFSYRLSAP